MTLGTDEVIAVVVSFQFVGVVPSCGPCFVCYWCLDLPPLILLSALVCWYMKGLLKRRVLFLRSAILGFMCQARTGSSILRSPHV